MTATDAHNHAEITAVNLADEHGEEADSALAKAKSAKGQEAIVAALCSIADRLGAIDARIDALRETLNRELPDIAGAIADAGRE